MTGIPSLTAALTDERISPWDFQLLFYLACYELSPTEFREMKVVAVAKHLDRDEDAIARSLNTLVGTGYLECLPRPHPGALAQYRFAWHTVRSGVPKAS